MHKSTFDKIQSGVRFLQEFRTLPKDQQTALIEQSRGIEAPIKNAWYILQALERDTFQDLDAIAAATDLKRSYVQQAINAMKQGGWEFQETRARRYNLKEIKAIAN